MHKNVEFAENVAFLPMSLLRLTKLGRFTENGGGERESRLEKTHVDVGEKREE